MVEYIWHNGEEPGELPVTQVHGVLFNQRGQILLRNDHGVYGLTGGTPEGAETRAETLHREVDEEINCQITDLEYLGFQEVRGDGEPYAQLRYFAIITKMGPARPDPDNGKTYEREYVTAADANKYLKYGKAGDGIIAAAIEVAKARGLLDA